MLILEWIFIILTFELSLIFLLRFIQPEKGLRNYRELGYFSLMMGLGLMWFFYILGDYYSSDEIIRPFLIWNEGSMRSLYLNLGYISIMICALFCIFTFEYYEIFLFKRYFFTVIFIIFLIMFHLVFLFDMRITQTLSSGFWILFFFFFLFYLRKFYQKIEENRRTRLIGQFFLGFLLLAIGFVFTTDTSLNALGIEFRLLGSISQLISIFIITNFFIKLPEFSEFDWKKKVEHIFLIDKGGICLYNQSLQKNSKLMDENLVAGAISSVNSLLSQLTQKEGISVIQKEGKLIITYPSEYVYGVLFCSEELDNIKKNLKSFVEKFELVYQDFLGNWNGDISIFSPVEEIVDQMFLNIQED